MKYLYIAEKPSSMQAAKSAYEAGLFNFADIEQKGKK